MPAARVSYTVPLGVEVVTERTAPTSAPVPQEEEVKVLVASWQEQQQVVGMA